MTSPFRVLPLLFFLLAVDAGPAFAESTLAAQGGSTVPSLRPYWHVFIAYAAAWLLVLGWIASIARRLARLERWREE